MNHTQNEQALFAECSMIVRYFIDVSPPVEFVRTYRDAIEKISSTFTAQENRIWQACLQQPWKLKYVDAYFAKIMPANTIRQRIWLTLALLETEPQFAQRFLPAKFSVLILPLIAIRLLLSRVRFIIGRILVYRA